MITLYTDGSCAPSNPGPGGWGVIIQFPDGSERELCGGEADTTNNRMEMEACIQGLSTLPAGSTVVLHTDSQYVQRGMTEWMKGWIRKGVMTSGAIKNHDLWLKLNALNAKHKIEWRWVRGHNGHPENERADVLAAKGNRMANGV